jgi:hypothetical protein
MFVAALTGFASGDSAVLLIPRNYLMGVILICVGVPLVVWRGLVPGTYFVLVLILMAGSISPIFLHGGAPLWENLFISVLSIISAFVITRFVLASSSEAYRVRSVTFSQWQGLGMGR